MTQWEIDLFFDVTFPVLIYLIIRNILVGKERQRVIDTIALLGLEDINADRPWMWRWNGYHAVSYEKMLFSVRRVKSFFKNSPIMQRDPDQNVWDFLDGKSE